MALSSAFLEQLLYEDESPSLDFKQEQYPFEKASDDQKSELLKDILAFVNAWRHSDAYILVGVKEVRGARSTVIGVSEHLDDAKLQQFVTSKTNRPAQFAYYEHTLDGEEVGILFIPLQQRPIYLKAKYGKLKKETVYIRRGSSTAIASPDEVSRIGSSAQPTPALTPTLDLQFYDRTRGQMLGNRVELPTVNIELPKQCEIPEYGVHYQTSLFSIPGFDANKNYYREYARYLQVAKHVAQVELAIENKSSVTALDVRIEAHVFVQGHDWTILDASEIPSKPGSSWLTNIIVPGLNPDIEVERLSDKYLITSLLGKIQPKATAHTFKGLFLGARAEEEIEIRARVFADNLTAPLVFALVAHIRPERKSIALEELLVLADRDVDR